MQQINKAELRKVVYQQLIPRIVWQKELTNNQKNLLEEWIKYYNVDRDVLRYYTDKRVLFELVKLMGNKELCLDSKIRWLLAMKIDQLIYYFYFYKMFEHPKTMYCGLAHFGSREPPPMEIKEKTKWQEEYWASKDNPKYLELIQGYDLGIDLDATNFTESYKDAKKLFNLFEDYKIKFSVWNSGLKGWHFKIPYEEFKELIQPFNIDKCVEFCRFLALDLKDYLKLKNVDTIIYSATRFLKCPYTIDRRNLRVIYPLSTEEFLNFKIEYMNIDYTLKNKELGFRGAYCNRQSNPEGFKKLVETI